jgi:hypothetical protein
MARVKVKMTIEELNAIKQTYHNLCFAYSDNQYFAKPAGTDIIRLSFLSQNQVLFKRITYYILYFTIIEINKLLSDSKRETYSIKKYILLELEDSNHTHKEELNQILNQLDNPEICNAKLKVYDLRNHATAHLTPERGSLRGKKLLVSEVEAVLALLNRFINVFSLILEGKEYTSPINTENLGYNLHKQHAKSLGYRNPST